MDNIRLSCHQVETLSLGPVTVHRSVMSTYAIRTLRIKTGTGSFEVNLFSSCKMSADDASSAKMLEVIEVSELEILS
jgi:hypothetical protein